MQSVKDLLSGDKLKTEIKSMVVGSDWETLQDGVDPNAKRPIDLKHPHVPSIKEIKHIGATPLMITLRAVFGELTVTFLFILVVCATGANLTRLNITDPTAGALSTALTAVALIYSFADVSGAHFNPAVTLGTIVRRKTSVLKGLFYMGAQLAGATLAILLINSSIFPEFTGQNLVIKPASDVSNFAALIMEFIMTFILVYVIFATAFETAGSDKPKVISAGDRSMTAQNLTIYTVSANSKAGFAPIAIGFTLGFLCFVGSSVSGGAFNPARVFGANVVSGDFSQSWIYYVGDFLGGACGALLQLAFATTHVMKETTKEDETAPAPTPSTSNVETSAPVEEPAVDNVSLDSPADELGGILLKPT